ncbi:MAG: hypothetical protein JWM05_1672, partial [Acidimicrobiales bacterium]|nr:hypothetical protein [Acidimicrobiales bacterium]
RDAGATLGSPGPSDPVRSRDRADDVVTRWLTGPDRPIASPLADLGPEIALPRGGALVITSPFSPQSDSSLAWWAAQGRLTSGRHGGGDRVALDVWQWSEGAVELSLRPVRRRWAPTWSGRRRQRFFDRAHAAARRLGDEIAPSGAPGGPALS